MIYGNANSVSVPNVDLLTFLFDYEGCRAKEDTPLHAEAADPSQVLTKAEARSLTKQLAHFLREKYGVGKDGPGKDVVLTVSSGQHRLACLFYAVVAAEGVYSAAGVSSTVPELTRQIKHGPAKLLVCSKDAEALAVAAAEEAGVPLSNVLIFESAPQTRLYSADGSAECDFTGSLDWRRITDTAELENNLLCLLYSSGTTGLPKGVHISHANIVSQCYIPSTMNRPDWATWSAPFESRTLGYLPTVHISGIQGYFINPFFDGGIVYWVPKFDFAEFIRYNATLGITTFFAVPPIYMGIAKHPLVTDQFSALRVAYCGAATLSQGLQAAASAKLGGGKTLIVQNWGMTETTGAVSHMPPNRSDSTGSISMLMPNMSMRLVNEDGQDVAPGEAGEALLKGPFLTKGYYNDEQTNKESFTEDGWFRTGDILSVKNDLLYLVDRKKEVIKAGEPIAPSEVEAVLVSHPSITDAAVAGIPSEEHGHALVRAYVAVDARAQGQLTGKEIVAFVATQLSGDKRLRGGVVFVAAVPRSPAGKILRKKLAETERLPGSVKD